MSNTAIDTGATGVGDKNDASLNHGTANGYGHGASVNRAITPGGHPLDQTQPAFPVYHRRFANPAPLGLCSFALTTLVLSLVNVQARHVKTPNLVLSLAFGYGGLVQLLAGMWEFAAGNTFGATAFSSYGGFWISYGLIFWPGSGILTAYTTAGELDSILGFYLAGWFIFTFIMLCGSLRSSLGLISVFFFLTITFLLLFIAEFVGNPVHSVKVAKAGGAFGIITAFCAFYVGMAGLLTRESSYFVLPVYELSDRV